MPNIMRNRLKCPKGSIDEIIQFLDGGEEQRIDFNKVYLQPPELSDRKVKLATSKGNPPDAESLELIKRYGADNRYEWRYQNWGTKWNAHRVMIDESCLRFETAWDTPRPIWIKLSEMFPDHVLEVYWESEALGLEAGTATLSAGEVTHFEDFSEERTNEYYRQCGVMV